MIVVLERTDRLYPDYIDRPTHVYTGKDLFTPGCVFESYAACFDVKGSGWIKRADSSTGTRMEGWWEHLQEHFVWSWDLCVRVSPSQMVKRMIPKADLAVCKHFPTARKVAPKSLECMLKSRTDMNLLRALTRWW